MKIDTPNILEKIVNNSNALIRDIDYEEYSDKHITILLFKSMLDIISDQSILIKANRFKSFFRLMRTCIEQYADLYNLSNSKNYRQNIDYTFLLNQKRFFKNAMNYKNNSSANKKITENKNFEGELNKCEQRLKNFKMKGAKKLISKVKFIDDHENDQIFRNLYTIAFNNLSHYVHGSYISLDDELIDFNLDYM